jgi:hypothetical protein
MAEAVLSGGVCLCLCLCLCMFLVSVCLSVCLCLSYWSVSVGINLIAYTNVCTHALSPTNMHKLLPLTLTHTHISI